MRGLRAAPTTPRPRKAACTLHGSSCVHLPQIWQRPSVESNCGVRWPLTSLQMPHVVAGYLRTELRERRLHEELLVEPRPDLGCEDRIVVKDVHNLLQLLNRIRRRGVPHPVRSLNPQDAPKTLPKTAPKSICCFALLPDPLCMPPECYSFVN